MKPPLVAPHAHGCFAAPCAPFIKLASNIWTLHSEPAALSHHRPDSSDSYLHRVGRAGRFGTKGLAITFASSDDDAKILEDVQSRFEVSITQLPESIDVSSYMTA